MRIPLLLYATFLVRLSSCGESSNLRKGVVDVSFDLSNPNSSLFSLADDLLYGVSHKVFVPKDGSSIVSVVDNGDTLWTATDTQEGCTGAYLFSREGYSSLLSVYTRGAGDETFCFEKVDGAWKNVDKRYFEHRLHSMKDLSAPSGEELGPEDLPEEVLTREDEDLPEVGTLKVESPVESNDELDFSNLGLPLGGSSGSEVPVEYSKPVVEKVEPQDDKDLLEAPAEEPENLPDAIVEEAPEDDKSEKVTPILTEPESIPPKESTQVTIKLEKLPSPSDLKVKVDESLFNVENGQENGIKILRLTVKNGTSTNELTFDGQTVWEDKKKLCSSAVIYMNGDRPTLAVLVTRDKKNKEGRVYKYHDGKKWKDGKEEDHDARLKKLKDKYNPDNTLDIAKPDESKINMDIKDSNGVRTKKYSPKDAFHISSVMDAGATVWKSSGDEKCVLAKLSTKGESSLLLISLESGYVYFEKNGSNWKEIKQDEFNGKLATLMGETLDLSNPDTSKILVHTETKSEVTVKYHYPKDTSKITTVVDGEKEVWKGVDKEHALSVLVYYAKENSSLITIGISKGDGSKLDFKHFEKNADGKWTSMTEKNDFLRKLQEMRYTD